MRPSYGAVSPEIREALDEAKGMLTKGETRFDTADEMFDSLGIRNLRASVFAPSLKT